MRKKLFLFDIDGTLISVNGIGKKAFNSALNTLFNKPDLAEKINMAGKSDLDTFCFVLKELEQPFSSELWDDFKIIFMDFMKIYAKTGIWKIVDGAEKFLEELFLKENFAALVTGNIEINAYFKLEQVNLRKMFETGGFGDNARTRDEILEEALINAYKKYGKNFSEIYVIGDTPLDIISAKKKGLKTIAIASGKYDENTLKKYNPDFLFSFFSSELFEIL